MYWLSSESSLLGSTKVISSEKENAPKLPLGPQSVGTASVAVLALGAIAAIW